MSFFRTQTSEKGSEFYSNLLTGACKNYIWVEKKLFRIVIELRHIVKILTHTKKETNHEPVLENSGVHPRRIEKREMIMLLSCVVLSILVHGIFVMDGFGEPDAARLAVQAAGWHQMGRIPILSYTVRVSPLYLHTLKTVLDFGCPLHRLANFMNWANVIIGSLTLIPLYFLWRLMSTPKAAAIGCLLYSFTPTFWQANIYSMPHLPSFACFVCALLLFAMSLQYSGMRFAALAAGSAILAALAMDLKADIILCFGAFFGIVVCLKSWNLRNVILSLLIPVVALIVVIMHSRLIAPVIPGTVEFAVIWSERFSFTIRAILDKTNRMIPVTAVGACLFSAVILSMIYCLVRRANLRLLFVALLWALPPMFFFNFKVNLARHLMASYSVLIFLVAVVFVSIIRNIRWGLALLAIVLVLNYFASPERNVRFRTGGRLIGSKINAQKRVDKVQMMGKDFAALPGQRKLLLGKWTLPYVVWEVLEEAADFDIKWSDKQSAWAGENMEIAVKRKDNSSYVVRVRKIMKRPVTITQPKGWRVWTCEPGISVVN